MMSLPKPAKTGELGEGQEYGIAHHMLLHKTVDEPSTCLPAPTHAGLGERGGR